MASHYILVHSLCCWLPVLPLSLWSILSRQVTHWAKDEYGKFYNGDSYIILNTYKEKDSEVL